MVAAGIIQSVNGQVRLDATRDFQNLGSLVSAKGDLIINAGRNIDLITRAVELTQIDHYSKNSEIGAAYGKARRQGDSTDQAMSYVVHKLAHAALGCAMGAAQGGENGCASGAVGGVMGEVLAEALTADLYDKMQQAKEGGLSSDQIDQFAADFAYWSKLGVDLAQLGAGLTAMMMGLDVEIAASAAYNAAEHNNVIILAEVAKDLLVATLLAIGTTITACNLTPECRSKYLDPLGQSLKDFVVQMASQSDEAGEGEETRDKPPAGSRSIDDTEWSGDHQDIKAGAGLGPKDSTKIDPDGNVWGRNPDGTWTNFGPASSYTESGRPSGRRGKDRESRRNKSRED